MKPLQWYLIAGIVLCAMAIAATLIRRLPLSTAMLYLPIGWALGHNGVNAIPIQIVSHAVLVEQITQAIILVSLFSAGLKMRLPITSRFWFLSLRPAFISMSLTVGLIAVAGVFLFGVPLSIAILMGGILAPTDPVLASDVQVENPYQLGALRFGLTSEAGMNDGSAFPFVLLGLMLLTKPVNTADLWRWFGVYFCWGTFAGVAAGFGVAALVGKYVLHLRTVHHSAVGLGYFLAPGLIALNYAVGELVHGYGFLSVFASAVTLRWIEMKSTSEQIPQLPLIAVGDQRQFEAAVDPDTAPVFLVELLLQFTGELEQIGELVVVVVVGALLTPAAFAGRNIAHPSAAVLHHSSRGDSGRADKNAARYRGKKSDGLVRHSRDRVVVLSRLCDTTRPTAIRNGSCHKHCACSHRNLSCNAWTYSDPPDELVHAQASSRFLKPEKHRRNLSPPPRGL